MNLLYKLIHVSNDDCHDDVQVDVIGVNVQDIIHPQDCSEIVRIFQSQGQDSEQGLYICRIRTF